MDGVFEVRNETEVLRPIPDGTEMAPSTRSDWIHHKYQKKRGFARL